MASTRGKSLFNCFRAHVHASTRCLQSKVAPFQQPFMEANVKGGPGPLADSNGPGSRSRWCSCIPCYSVHQAHQTRSQLSYIFCHCHASGKLNVSSFSCFTEFSALAAAAPHAGWPGLPARCRAAGNGVKTVTQEYRPSTGPIGSRTRRRGPSAGLERGQCAQPHQVWHIVGDIEGFGFDLLISRC